jgi:polyhydroxybutyrate depolymerase
MMHGGLGSGEQAENTYGWNARADAAGFVVAYPDGLNRAWVVSDGCCGPAVRDGVDDVTFITELVRTLSGWLPVDAARVFATGMSNGALLAYRLACDTEVFAAIGPVAGTQVGECPNPRPTSVIHIHGTADQHIPYQGGPSKLDNGGTGRSPIDIDGPAVPDLIARWQTIDSCAPPTITTRAPVTTQTATCAQGRAVELITVAGAGHQWPGGKRGADAPSTALDATAVVWDFFAAHPRP